MNRYEQFLKNGRTANWRFGATAAVARRKGSAKLKGSSPLKW